MSDVSAQFPLLNIKTKPALEERAVTAAVWLKADKQLLQNMSNEVIRRVGQWPHSQNH